MIKKNYNIIFYIVITVAYIFINAFYYQFLPEKAAAHFAFSGKADAWMPKGFLTIFNICIYFLISGILVTFAYAFKYFPENTINLPNKNFWLNQENKLSTYNYLKNWTLKLTNILCSFFLLLLIFTLEANFTDRKQLPFLFPVVFIVLMIVITYHTVSLYKKFRVKN